MFIMLRLSSLRYVLLRFLTVFEIFEKKVTQSRGATQSYNDDFDIVNESYKVYIIYFQNIYQQSFEYDHVSHQEGLS